MNEFTNIKEQKKAEIDQVNDRVLKFLNVSAESIEYFMLSKFDQKPTSHMKKINSIIAKAVDSCLLGDVEMSSSQMEKEMP